LAYVNNETEKQSSSQVMLLHHTINTRLRYHGNILQKNFSDTKIPAPRESTYLCSKSHSQKNIYHGITKYAGMTVKFRNLNSAPTPKGKQHTGPCNGAQTLCGVERRGRSFRTSGRSLDVRARTSNLWQ